MGRWPVRIYTPAGQPPRWRLACHPATRFRSHRPLVLRTQGRWNWGAGARLLAALSGRSQERLLRLRTVPPGPSNSSDRNCWQATPERSRVLSHSRPQELYPGSHCPVGDFLPQLVRRAVVAGAARPQQRPHPPDSPGSFVYRFVAQAWSLNSCCKLLLHSLRFPDEWRKAGLGCQSPVRSASRTTPCQMRRHYGTPSSWPAQPLVAGWQRWRLRRNYSRSASRILLTVTGEAVWLPSVARREKILRMPKAPALKHFAALPINQK